MSTRRHAKQDSLELLLDTICNTFGGVLFIAILVVLLLQQSGGSPVQTDSVPATEAEIIALQMRLESATHELAQQQQNRDSQDTLVRSFAPESIRGLLQNRQTIQAAHDQLQAEIDQELIENANRARDVESIEASQRSLIEELQKSKSQKEALEAKIDAQRKLRQEEVRMPVVRRSRGKSEIGLILRYGRLYVWHEYGQFGEPIGLNKDDFVVVDDSNKKWVTQPNPLRGVPINNTEDSRKAMMDVLRQFNAAKNNLSVVVRPDSNAEFRILRDLMIQQKFEYRLMPVDFGVEIYDRGGTDGRVQ